MQPVTMATCQSDFLHQTMMGPNALRIIEELALQLPLTAGMRVLDLGCGCGLTSLFLASNFPVTVYATDLWISATDNLARICQFNLEDRIIPLWADVQQLPFAENYFDAVVCIDAYHYFGHKAGFLDQFIAPLVKPGGFIAIVVPGIKQPFIAGVPTELQPFWKEEFNFYPPEWWQNLWQASTITQLIQCREMACCQQAWAEWLACDNPYAISDRAIIAAENGNYFNLIQLIAQVN